MTDFSLGATVNHAIYGAGTVTAVDGDKFVMGFADGSNHTFVKALAPISLDSAEMRETVYAADDHFNGEVRDELRRQLIREKVQEARRASKEAQVEPFDAGLLCDILARPADPPMRVDGLIPSAASVLLSAQRKTGKTTWLLNYARALIEGSPLLGRFDTRPIAGNVALLNYEVSGATVGRWADEHNIDGRRLLLVNLRGRRNPLNVPEDRSRLAGLLRLHDVEAVIVDPFGRAYNGKSQNDPGEVTNWLVDLDRFVRGEVGATDLVLSAHAGWNGERTRGASSLEDWADVIITMTRDADDETQRFIRAIGRDVEVDEDRLDYHAPTRTLTLAGVGSRKKAGADRKVDDLAVFTLRAARQQPGASVAALEGLIRAMDDAPPFRNGEVSRAAKWAESQGLMRIVPGGPGRRSEHYAVDNPTPPNPSPTSPRDLPQPLPPLLYRGGVGGGGSGALPLPDKSTS